MASKKNKSFADQAKKIMSKYALRPDDNASKTAMNRELDILKEEQEIERQQMAQEAMETLNSLGMAPPMQGTPQEMPPEMAMQQGQGMPQQMPPQQEMMGPPPQGMPMQQAYGGDLSNQTTDDKKKIYSSNYSALSGLSRYFDNKDYKEGMRYFLEDLPHNSPEWESKSENENSIISAGIDSASEYLGDVPLGTEITIENDDLKYYAPGAAPRKYGGNLYAEGGILNTTEDTPGDPPVSTEPRTKKPWEYYNPTNLENKINELDAAFTDPVTGKRLTETQAKDTIMNLHSNVGRQYVEGDSINTSSLFHQRIDGERILDKKGNYINLDNPEKDIAWSATTTSNLVMDLYNQDKKGIENIGFKPSTRHSDYITDAFKSKNNSKHKYDLYQPLPIKSPTRGSNAASLDQEELNPILGIGDMLFFGREEAKNWKFKDFEKAANKNSHYLSHSDIITSKGSDEDGYYYVISGGNTSDEKSGLTKDTFGHKKVYYNPNSGEIIGKKSKTGFSNPYKGIMQIKETRRAMSNEPMETLSPEQTQITPAEIKKDPEMMFQEMVSKGFDPNQLAYGGNMRKKYYHGGPHGDDEDNIGINFNRIETGNNVGGVGISNYEFNSEEFLDLLKKQKNKEENTVKEENTFDGKMDTGDYIAAGIGGLGDIYGLSHALKKPEKRGRMSTSDETFDSSPYDRAFARGNEGIRNISRRNPNAALSQQIAGNTSLNTGITGQEVAARAAVEGRNIQRQMGVDQFNLSQDERDRQALDSRAGAISGHLTNLGDIYTGVKGDKDKMAMEATIMNSMDTENYTYKWVDGKLVPTPKIIKED